MLRTISIALILAPLAVAQTVSVLDMGARPDGSAAQNTTAALAAAFQIAPAGLIRVPAGVYAIDNNAGPFLVNAFSGQLIFEGGAKLVFLNAQNGGIWFVGGNRARIQGLRIAYANAPTVRNSPQEAVKFSSTTDTSLTDAIVESSPAAGILFFDSIRPRVTNATILNSMADGLHFANCQDAQVNGLSTVNTGDDGLAFLNYSQFADRSGGTATNIVVRQSGARGITVLGSSDVVINNFLVDGTASSGVLCGQDASYNTRSSDRVLFTNGIIRDAGTVSPAVGNNFGIEYNGQKSCSFAGIEVIGAAGRGVSGSAPDGRIRLTNIRVRGNAQGEAFSLFRTGRVEIESAIAEDAPSYGFYFGECDTIVAQGLTALNTSKTNPLSRAVWFENNQRVVASEVHVMDSQDTPTGYVLGGFQDSAVQNGKLSGISGLIDNGSLLVLNSSSMTISP